MCSSLFGPSLHCVGDFTATPNRHYTVEKMLETNKRLCCTSSLSVHVWTCAPGCMFVDLCTWACTYLFCIHSSGLLQDPTKRKRKVEVCSEDFATSFLEFFCSCSLSAGGCNAEQITCKLSKNQHFHTNSSFNRSCSFVPTRTETLQNSTTPTRQAVCTAADAVNFDACSTAFDKMKRADLFQYLRTSMQAIYMCVHAYRHICMQWRDVTTRMWMHGPHTLM